MPAETRTISAPDLAVLLGAWSAGGSGSLSRRLAYALRSAIATGLLPPGTRLPSERVVADALAVSRGTLTVALDELRGEGVLVSRQGSGTAVAGTASEARPGAPVVVDRLRGASGTVNLSASDPPGPVHLPPVALSNDDLLTVTSAEAYDPLGLARLRQAVARRYTERLLPTGADHLVVTHGAHQAIALAVRLLCQPGDVFLVEDPTYPGIIDVLRARGARPVAVPRDGAGPDPSALAELARRYRPAGAYLMTGVHSPTGTVTNETRRRDVAAVVDDLGLPVVEDNVLDDLVFAGARPGFLAAACRKATILGVDSPSKVAWDGFRVGWLRGPQATIERGARALVAGQLGASVPAQLLVATLLPSYDELVGRRRVQLARDAAFLADALGHALPEWQVLPPQGGLSLWVEIGGKRADAFAQRALRHGVSVAPGTAFSVEHGDGHLRLCFDRPRSELAEGVARLGAAWRDA